MTGAPQPVANDYLVMGVVERRTWQKALSEALPIQTLLEHTADIEQYYPLSSSLAPFAPTRDFGGSRRPVPVSPDPP